MEKELESMSPPYQNQDLGTFDIKHTGQLQTHIFKLPRKEQNNILQSRAELLFCPPHGNQLLPCNLCGQNAKGTQQHRIQTCNFAPLKQIRKQIQKLMEKNDLLEHWTGADDNTKMTMYLGKEWEHISRELTHDFLMLASQLLEASKESLLL